MSRFTSTLFAASVLLVAGSALAQSKFTGVGRSATPAEIKAWDIDVRPDFKGLPAGSGSVSKGQEVWEAKCSTCHGVFGESNEVFTPIVGGTTKEDIKTGRVKALLNPEQPRTTLMKLSTVSTLWDYINRAMPWNAPKSLSIEEVYAVTAYILSLGAIVPDDFVLSDKNIGEVQNLLPNRNGMTKDHGLWDIHGKPDVKNVACMKNCPTEVKITSTLPAQAKGASGNLAEQNRGYGAVRGQVTTKLAEGSDKIAQAAPPPAKAAPGVAAKDLANQSGCLACHGVANKIVGPGFSEVAAKYKGEAGAEAKLTAKVKSGGAGVWGLVPMPAQSQLKDDDIKTLVQWVLGGAK